MKGTTVSFQDSDVLVGIIHRNKVKSLLRPVPFPLTFDKGSFPVCVPFCLERSGVNPGVLSDVWRV